MNMMKRRMSVLMLAVLLVVSAFFPRNIFATQEVQADYEVVENTDDLADDEKDSSMVGVEEEFGVTNAQQETERVESHGIDALSMDGGEQIASLPPAGTTPENPIVVEAGKTISFVEEQQGGIFSRYEWKYPTQVMLEDENTFRALQAGNLIEIQYYRTSVISGSQTLLKTYYVKIVELKPSTLLRPDNPAADGVLEPGEISAFKDAQWVSTKEGEYIAEISFDLKGIEIEEGSDVIIVLDNSGSMIVDNRYRYARDAVKVFANGLFANGNEDNNRVAFVEFESNVCDAFNFVNNESDFNMFFEEAITSGQTSSGKAPGYPFGGTNYTQALQRVESLMSTISEDSRPKHVIFISDGAPGATNGDGKDDVNWNGLLQANALRDSEVYIHTIGIDMRNQEPDALRQICSGHSYYDVRDVSTELAPVLEDISNDIRYAATNAIVSDVVSDSFELVDSTLYPLPEEAIVSGQSIEIPVGTITSTTETISFYVRYVGSGGDVYAETNDEALLEYVDINGEESEKFSDKDRGEPVLEGDERYTGLDSPLLPIPPNGMINMVYYYEHEDGFVSKADPSIGCVDKAFAKTQRSVYEENGLSIFMIHDEGVLKHVEGIAPEGYEIVSTTIQGQLYQTSYDVVLSEENMSPTVEFVLRKIEQPPIVDTVKGSIQIVYYYEGEEGFVLEADTSQSTNDVALAKKDVYVYTEDGMSEFVVDENGLLKFIQGYAPDGYEVIETTMFDVLYQTQYDVKLTLDNPIQTVSFVLRKVENDVVVQEEKPITPATRDTSNTVIYWLLLMVATLGLNVWHRNKGSRT